MKKISRMWERGGHGYVSYHGKTKLFYLRRGMMNNGKGYDSYHTSRKLRKACCSFPSSNKGDLLRLTVYGHGCGYEARGSATPMRSVNGVQRAGERDFAL